ncbi:MAG: NAD(P)-dependent oxidoreductase [Oscillospiraceae bacterium]|nr:NAD(P)-dependent oxidoreductase [Oscillospiraceae bacterium]
MKVIVTGASGFLGKALCSELRSNGHDVTAIVRNKNVCVDADKIICCDLNNYYQLSEIITDRGFDVLYHFAWAGTSGSARGDYSLQIDNIKASCILTEQCRLLDCRRIVYASSIMEYEISALMKTETDPPVSSVYSAAKMTSDYMMKALAVSNKTEYIRGIISNVYGPGENSPRLVNTTIRKLLKNEHCAFSPGEQMYDFIYIDDAVKAFAAIGEKGTSGRTYYIGSEKPGKLKEFLIKLKDIVASDAIIGIGEIPFNGVSIDYEQFDKEAVLRDTGFRNQITFSEGIKRTAEWIRKEM